MNIAPFQIDKSLVLLDLSTTDAKVLDYLHYLLLQKIELKDISFLHVIQKGSFFSNFFFRKETANRSQFILDEDIIKTFKKNVATVLSSSSASSQLSYHVEEGQPLNIIIDSIQDQQAGLVILGKKTKKNSAGVLGRNIARMSSCPILFVPDQAIPKISYISVAVDFSETAGNALQMALAIANTLPDPVTIDCVYVYDVPNFRLYKNQYSYKEFKTMLLEKAEKAFEAFLNRFAPNIPIEKKLVEHSHFNIASHLVETFNSNGTDLVLIGAKGHSSMERLFLGSVTESLLQLNDSIPTLIVR